jgi:hypothetical protein
VNDTAAIIAILILLNVGQGGILIRLRRIEKSIERVPFIIKMQFEGQQRYVELLEKRLRDSQVEKEHD